MLWWYFKGFVGAFAFHFGVFLFLLSPFVGVLSSQGKKVVDIVVPGLEEFFDLFEFVDWFPDFPYIHIWEESNNVTLLIFVVSVNRNNKNIGKEEE